MEDCCETVFGLKEVSTSHDSHVVDVPFLYCGTYEELAANDGHGMDNGGNLALPRRSDQDGDSGSERIESGVRDVNVTAAHLLNMALSHASNVYVPWCQADACGQPVRSVCAGNLALVCHWAEMSSDEGVGYEFQLFDRSKPGEPVYEWDFLVSSMEIQGVTEEMKGAVEAFILLSDDSESEEGNESVGTISISS